MHSGAKDSPVAIHFRVSSDDAAALHSLIAKVQSSNSQLSECIAEGVGIARGVGVDSLAEFCSRELTAYFARDGEIEWPFWRRTESYKIPAGTGLNFQTVHPNEDSYLADLATTLHAVLSPDYWCPSVGETEQQLSQMDERAASGNGFSLCIRKLPMSLYNHDPKWANQMLSVITPTRSIREVLRRTKEEFTQRLLKIEADIVRDEPRNLKMAADRTDDMTHRPRQWKMICHLMADGSLEWVLAEGYPAPQSSIRIQFSRSGKRTEREALKSIADGLAARKVAWLKPISNPRGKWIIDLDGLKVLSTPILDDTSKFSGRVFVKPKCEFHQDMQKLLRGETFGRDTTYIWFDHPIEGDEGVDMIVPGELQPFVDKFRIDHPDSSKAAFVMMRFTDTPLQLAAFDAVQKECAKLGVMALRADSKLYAEEKWANIRTYMHGCGFGIALFERITEDDFNPNVSLEVGYMMGMGKRVLMLKDQTLPRLQGDLDGRLYVPFDPQDAKKGIAERVCKWLRDFELIGPPKGS